MAKRVARSFFKTKEAYFIGYSQKGEVFCDLVRTAFEKNGAKVYPINPKGTWGATAVYRSPEEAPARPEFAYVLTRKELTAGIVDGLAKLGVKRVVFNSMMSVDTATLAHCAKLGMETAVACPMMALGGGFHRFHGWLAGVRA